MLDIPGGATGGLCSVGYEVTHTSGRTAFMKAHDYARAIQQGAANFSSVMQDMLVAYNLEKDVNDRCTANRMSRVVRSLAAGAVAVEGSEIPVTYIIFELAQGDIRQRLDDPQAGVAWKLRTLHHVAVGLSQLHRNNIIHQDLKPSNVMDFETDVGAKLGDLGSSWMDGKTAPRPDRSFAGDPDYAPPECLWGYELPTLRERLIARDVYLFGSLIPFFWTGVDATSALIVRLPPAHHPRRSALGFEDALPYLRQAFDEVVDSLSTTLEGSEFGELAHLFAQLCDPDPRVRGDRMAVGRFSNRFSLERAISLLDKLAAWSALSRPLLR